MLSQVQLVLISAAVGVVATQIVGPMIKGIGKGSKSSRTPPLPAMNAM
jgi:hypothetical protein